MWAADTVPGQSDTGAAPTPLRQRIEHYIRPYPAHLPPRLPLIYTKYLNYNAETHLSTE